MRATLLNCRPRPRDGLKNGISGSLETLYNVMTGTASWGVYFSGCFLPTLLDNVLGGAALVAALNDAQVVAGKGKDAAKEDT